MNFTTLPLGPTNSNPMWDAQMALYTHGLVVDEAWSLIPAGEPRFDFDLTPPHVEKLAAELLAHKDEVLDRIHALTWQQRFFDGLPFKPYFHSQAGGPNLRGWMPAERPVPW